MNKLNIGKRNEFKVWARLLAEGIDVYPSIVDDRGVDGIVGYDSKYYEVQIKSGKNWNNPRGISKRICETFPKRIFIIYNYNQNKIIFLTGKHIIEEPEWSKTINWDIPQLKWNKKLLEKYGNRDFKDLVEYLKNKKSNSEE